RRSVGLNSPSLKSISARAEMRASSTMSEKSKVMGAQKNLKMAILIKPALKVAIDAPKSSFTFRSRLPIRGSLTSQSYYLLHLEEVYRRCGGSEVRITISADSPCGLLSQSNAR